MTIASKRIIWAQHLIFWGSLLFVTLYVSLGIYSPSAALARFTSATVLNLCIYLICYFWLVDSYYERQKYWQFFVGLVMVILASTIMRALIERYFYLNMTPDLTLKPERRQMAVIMMYFSQGIIVVVSSLLAISKNKLVSEQRLIEADRIKAETELSLLKAKINPHFLLNTLNNIYYHSREEGGKSSESIVHLSQLLQFTIYETSRKRVALEREIEILHGLAELYRLRFKQELNIVINVHGNADDVEVSPSVMLVLLENALKHSGIGLDDDSFINLEIEIGTNQLLVTVSNSAKGANENATSVYSGLGLSSLREMLAMEYPNSHKLDTYKANDIFHANLIISL